MNIFLQLEANPVQMCLLYFYPAVLVNSKLDYCSKIRAACTARLFFSHWANQILICGVVVAVDVVDAKDRYYLLTYAMMTAAA